MSPRVSFLAAFGACLALLLPVAASTQVRVLASVDGSPVTTQDLDDLLAAQKRPAPGTEIPTLSPDGVLKRLIENRLLEDEGFRIRADQESDVKDQVWDFRRHRGMIALLDSVQAEVEPPSPEPFDALMDETSTMWRVYHIRTATEAKANALLDSLKAGVPFADLARRHSTDSTSAARDGELGWAREDLYIPEFRQALTRMAKGDLTRPVKYQDGWHILKLADTRTESVGQSGAMKEQLKDAAMREAVMVRVKEFVASLRKKYGVVVDEKLRDSLDYGSTDAAVQKKLHDDHAVVATLPWKKIDVSDLTRRIRFQNFHGLEGKGDAGQIRDKVLEEWVTELLLRQEAGERGYDKTPDVLRAADALRRELMREYVGRRILDVPFDPKPADVERYYRAHTAEFTPAPRVRVDAAVLADEASGREFRKQVEDGAKLKWLAGKSPQVKDASPAALADWVDPVQLGLRSASDAAPGKLVGPLPGEAGWLVASITQVEKVSPPPLAKCKDQVIATMKKDRVGELMSRAITQLWSAARIETADGAKDAIAARLVTWTGEMAGAAGPRPASMPPGHGGGAR